MKKTNGDRLFYLPIIIVSLLSIACKNGDVDSISLTETNKYLSIGDTLKIGYTKIEPEDKDYELTWSSSNETVASVDEKGIVRAKSEGRANITAKSGKRSAHCEINVVTYGFKNAAIFATSDNSLFYFRLSTNNSTNNSIQAQYDVLVFDLVLPKDSTSIVKGNYSIGNEGSAAPYFYPGQQNSDLTGSYLIKATNDILLITSGNFSVSRPDDSYFILGDLKSETESFSFIYEGKVTEKRKYILD